MRQGARRAALPLEQSRSPAGGLPGEDQEDGRAGPGWGLPVRATGKAQGRPSALSSPAAVVSEGRLQALTPGDDSASWSRRWGSRQTPRRTARGRLPARALGQPRGERALPGDTPCPTKKAVPRLSLLLEQALRQDPDQLPGWGWKPPLKVVT